MMKALKRMKYSELKHRVELLVNARAFSIDCQDRRTFQQAIEALEQEIYRRETRTLRSLLAGVACLLLITIAGCQTVKGVTGDAGWILTELSENITTE